jgi:hypothetical protein
MPKCVVWAEKIRVYESDTTDTSAGKFEYEVTADGTAPGYDYVTGSETGKTPAARDEVFRVPTLDLDWSNGTGLSLRIKRVSIANSGEAQTEDSVATRGSR